MNNRLLASIIVLSVAFPFSWPSSRLIPFFSCRSAFAKEKLDQAKAVKHFEKGRNFYENSKFLEACDEFIKSYEYSKNPLLLFNIAKSYQEADELYKSKEYYLKFLKEAPKSENTELAQDELKKIETELAKRIERLEVYSTDGIGYSIFVDGSKKKSCATPCQLKLTPGKHKIFAISKKGYQKLFNILIDGPHAPLEIANLGLPNSGSLSLSVEDFAQIKLITLDGKPEKLQGDSLHNIPRGTHILRLETTKLNWETPVVIAADKTTDVRLLLEQMKRTHDASTSWKAITAYVALGAGTATLGGAIYSGVMTSHARKLLAAHVNNTAIRSDIASYGKQQKLMTNVLYGVGGGLLAIGVGFLLWDLLETPTIKNEVSFVPNQ